MSNVTNLPNAHLGRLKQLRRRIAVFPAGHHESIYLCRFLVELLDALLLEAGDTEIQTELARQHAQLTAQLPSNVMMVAAPPPIAEPLPPVMIIQAGQGGPETRPQIVQKPSIDVTLTDPGTLPHAGPVAIPSGLPPGLPTSFAGLGSAVPSVGSVRMVKEGEDPIAAMDEPVR